MAFTQKPRTTSFPRRKFLALTTTGAVGLMSLPHPLAASTAPPTPSTQPKALAMELVEAFVRAAHIDLEQTRKLLKREPALLNATWDWGGGDFETAIGGAGHMGRGDIALYLLENGARMDLFVATMLGELEIVKATLTAFPELMHSKGPHGIPLMIHAEKGGKQAAEVLKYLQDF